jgi:hypothetical protein
MAKSRKKTTDLDLGQVCKEWEGFRICPEGMLHNPMWRRGFTPGELKAQFWQLQQLGLALHEMERLRAELGRAINAQHAAEARSYFYKSQLVLESRLGLMLQAATTTN